MADNLCRIVHEEEDRVVVKCRDRSIALQLAAQSRNVMGNGGWETRVSHTKSRYVEFRRMKQSQSNNVVDALNNHLIPNLEDR